MQLGDLTTTNAIRAVLGISEESQELSDSVFVDNETALEIQVSIDSWLEESMSEATDSATIVSSGTSSQKTLLYLVAKYMGALLYVPSLATTTAKKLSDGQDEFQRQDRDLAALQKDLEKVLARYQNSLLKALEPAVTAGTFSIMGSSSPSFDPITGA